MIDFIKNVEPDTGYAPLLKASQTEAAMRESRTRKTKTVCTYCGVGCSFDVWTKGRHILKIEPYAGPVNGISTCIKGKFGWGYINAPDRLTKPLIRENGKFREASWEEALNLVASRFSEIKAKHGPDALGFVASSKCTNEETYLMQKLARAVIGTNNIDNCSRYCQAPATKGLTRTVGLAGDTGSISDIAQADLVLAIATNTAESHPVLASRVKEAHKLRGQKLIVVDIRKHEMAERADYFMHPKPGTDLIWISAITRYILDQGLAKTDFLAQWVNGLDDYRKSLEPFTMEFAAETCGVAVQNLEKLARMIVEAKSVCILWGDGCDAAHDGLRHLDRDLPTCLWSPAITCGPAPAPIRCAATTTCRARAITAHRPKSCPATRKSATPRSVPASRRRGRSSSPPARASTTTK